MIDPTASDIGRKVIYREQGNFPGRKIEEGVITSFNKQFVFVRYEGLGGSAATAREDLEWVTSNA